MSPCGGSNPLSSPQRFPWLWPGCSCHSPFLRGKSRGSSGHSVLALRKDFAIGLVQSEGFFSPGIVPRRFVVCTMYAHLHFWPSTHQTKIFVKHGSTNVIWWVFKEIRNKLSKNFKEMKRAVGNGPIFWDSWIGRHGRYRPKLVWNYVEIWLVQVTKFCSFYTRKLSKPCMINPINTFLNSTTSKDIQ